MKRLTASWGRDVEFFHRHINNNFVIEPATIFVTSQYGISALLLQEKYIFTFTALVDFNSYHQIYFRYKNCQRNVHYWQ